MSSYRGRSTRRQTNPQTWPVHLGVNETRSQRLHLKVDGLPLDAAGGFSSIQYLPLKLFQVGMVVQLKPTAVLSCGSWPLKMKPCLFVTPNHRLLPNAEAWRGKNILDVARQKKSDTRKKTWIYFCVVVFFLSYLFHSYIHKYLTNYQMLSLEICTDDYAAQRTSPNNI